MRRHDQPAIDLYFPPTPEGQQITIMLEECGQPYNLVRANAATDDETADLDVLRVSPDERRPAIVDHETGAHVFEAGAILQYLAEKAGRFLPVDPDGKYAVLQWVFWVARGLSPMASQLAHFAMFAPGGAAAHDYACQRFQEEYDRHYQAIERVLGERAFLGGDYSIADMAVFPWVAPYKRLSQDMQPYPNVRRWFDTLKHRPGVRRGMSAATSA